MSFALSLRRWALPLGVAAVVLGMGVAVTALRASADPTLPPRSAAQLLVDVQTARLEGLSGTVVQRADLGLPAIPLGGGGTGSAELSSLISGSHTLRVWYSGPDKVRVALLGRLGESDIVANGRDLWIWSSSEQTATHRTLPEGLDALHPDKMLPVTPQEAADQVLALLDPTTVVTTDGTDRVAGRPVYELVLAPRDGASLVSQVRLAVDAEKRVPLRFQVLAKGTPAPAFEIGFTQVTFQRPGDEHFTFTPPPNTRVQEEDSRPEKTAPDRTIPREKLVPPDKREELRKHLEQGTPATADRSRTLGEGWTTVLVTRVDGNLPEGANALLNGLTPVSGGWGSGRLLRTRLVTALLTDDGRLLVGAVTPERLYATAADPAAALK